jgi:hypothetical protein
MCRLCIDAKSALSTGRFTSHLINYEALFASSNDCLQLTIGVLVTLPMLLYIGLMMFHKAELIE